MRKKTQQFKCGKCDKGITTRIVKETRKGCEITMKKCDSCKYQYGLKEVNVLELISEIETE